MGDEALCRAWIDGAEVKGKALLDTNELISRGEGQRYVIPLRSRTAATVESGRLSIAHDGGGAMLDAWMPVSGLGVIQADFLTDLNNRVGPLKMENLLPNSDIIFLGAEERPGLDQLRSLQDSLA